MPTGHQASHRPRIQSSSLEWVWEFWISREKLSRPWNLDQNSWDTFWIREWPVKLCSRVTRVWQLSLGSEWLGFNHSVSLFLHISFCLSLPAGRCQLACAMPLWALEVCMWQLASGDPYCSLLTLQAGTRILSRWPLLLQNLWCSKIQHDINGQPFEVVVIKFGLHSFSICQGSRIRYQLCPHDANYPDGKEQLVCHFGPLTFQRAEISQLSESVTW